MRTEVVGLWFDVYENPLVTPSQTKEKAAHQTSERLEDCMGNMSTIVQIHFMLARYELLQSC